MDGHLGANLNTSSTCDHRLACSAAASGANTCAPAISGAGGFKAGLTDGFTLEAWVTPDPDISRDHVIASLSAA